MVGESDLSTLLCTLTTTCHPSIFVFATFPQNGPPIPATLDTQMTFQEPEGTTVITTLASAEFHKLEYQFPCRMLTLNVHSSLAAVGFMAVIATRLSDAGVSSNPVSGYFHDHVFVPAARAEDAVEVLRRLAEEARGETSKGGGPPDK